MLQNKQTLADIPSGSDCIVISIHGHGGFRHRIMEMGFVKGEKVEVVRNAPLMDPIEYEVMGNHVSLRRAEAAFVEVVQTNQYAEVDVTSNATLTEEVNYSISELSHTISVALVGNPNCGKTSFFNHATGLREKVGNYGGVTVDSKQGVFHHKGYTIVMTDLPGTYSLAEYTPEEKYVRSFLNEQQPDVVLNIVDASNLERNLFLTTQLIDLNQRMVMALNMYDELEKSGSSIDLKNLSRMLGFPIIPTVSSSGVGIDNLLDHIIDVYDDKQGSHKHIHINYGADLEKAIDDLKTYLDKDSFNALPVRYLALKMLEDDDEMLRKLSSTSTYENLCVQAAQWRAMLEKEYKQDLTSLIAEARYAFVRGALKETLIPGDRKINDSSYRMDRWLTHRWLGFPILLLFLWLMFQTTFTLGAYPQEWIEAVVYSLGEALRNLLPPGILADLLVDGILAGVGGVIVFLPNILILFLFISVLEDTGYMARAAFIMDKLMHRMGLHGKSFIPYLIGFGCGVPAIMATRTLGSRKDRIITMLTIPFMSCAARLPVYILFVSAFFVRYQGMVLLSIYAIGIVVAIGTALLLRHTLFSKEDDQFVMELPPYRVPTWRNAVVHMWDKSLFYLKKMGTVILVASVIVWALGYFPRPKEDMSREEQMEQSYIGQLGHAIEPVVRPLGFDWKMGVSLLTGLGAKEIVVSSMGILYQGIDDADETSQPLIESLRNQRHTSGIHVGEKVFTPVIAYSFMLFILLYFPCIATLSALRKEAGNGWALISVVYTTCIAWIVSFLTTNLFTP